jgi:hypothetical protein
MRKGFDRRRKGAEDRARDNARFDGGDEALVVVDATLEGAVLATEKQLPR